jgi:Crinkler effector protein N-terminal domain
MLSVARESKSRRSNDTVATNLSIIAMSLSLNCLVLGDKPERMFTVKIPKTNNVSILKKLINEKKAPHLNHHAASDLDLWNVSIPMDDDTEERLKNINNLELLKPLLPLSRVFPHVEENHLHILILNVMGEPDMTHPAEKGVFPFLHFNHMCRWCMP